MAGAGAVSPAGGPHAAHFAGRRMGRGRLGRRGFAASARGRHGRGHPLCGRGSRRPTRPLRPDQCGGRGQPRPGRRAPAARATIPAAVIAGGARAGAVALRGQQAPRGTRGRGHGLALDGAATSRRLRARGARAASALSRHRARHGAVAGRWRRALLASLRRRSRDGGVALARRRHRLRQDIRAR